MAFPVIPEKYLDDFPQEKAKEKIKDTVVVAASKVSSGVGKVLDFLILLTAAFWYYFFTGLAIVLKRRVPKEWMRLGTHLGMSRVSSRIKIASQNALQKEVATKNAPKRTFKVIDIDTKRPIKVLKATK